MYRELEDLLECFRDLLFKFSLLENDESLKQAMIACLQNNIAEVNKPRMNTSITRFAAILQEVASCFHETKSEPDNPSALNSIRGQGSTSYINLQDNVQNTSGSSYEKLDPRFVQITVDKKEVDRRINAFTERQRIRVNLANVQEFCRIDQNSDDSCARVDAILVPRTGSKSHILVRKVVNHCGPQMKDPTTWLTMKPDGSDAAFQCRHHQTEESISTNSSIEERLKSMEMHLHTYSDGPVPKNVYKRLQELENRLLHLESISPEYFSQIHNVKRKRLNSGWVALLQLEPGMESLRP